MKGGFMSVRRLIDKDYSFGNGQLDIISGLDECLQTCKTTLMQLKGEWFLNYTDGVAWGDVLGHSGNTQELAALVKRNLLSGKGVVSVDAITVDVDNRHAYIITKLDTDFGLVNFSQSFNVLELLANDKINE